MDPIQNIQFDNSLLATIIDHVGQISSQINQNSRREPFHSLRHQLIFEEDRRATRGIIALSTKGCTYAKRFGPCTICGHLGSCIWDTDISDEGVLKLFHKSLAQVRIYRPETLCIYCSGSFCDDFEVSKQVRSEILRVLANEDWIHNVIFESLPQFITQETAKDIAEHLLHKVVMIGVGLDCSTQPMRSILTFKRIPNGAYKTAAKVCRNVGILPIAYVVVKPPFLTEGESVWEAAEAIHKASQFGYKHISLEPLALQHGTLQSLLWLLKLYDRPTIWTILDSILFWRKRYSLEYKSLTLHIGGEIFTPEPYLTYAMCKSCESAALPALRSLGVNFRGRPLQEQRDTCCNRGHILISKPSMSDLIDRIKNAEISIRNRDTEQKRGPDYACPAI